MKRILIILISIVIFSITFYLFFFDINLLISWHIYIPAFNNLEYTKVSDPSFPSGSGRSYTVYKYESTIKKNIIDHYSWQRYDASDKSMQENIIFILDMLEVKNNKRPNFEKDFKYILLEKKYSKLYMLYFNNDTLYIIEEF